MKKRFLALLLACMMVTALCPRTLAADPADFPPMEEWSDEKWVISEQWTDADWQAYYDAQMERERRLELQEMGATVMDGVNVKVNGSFLSFVGAPAYEEGGCTMVPARALFEALGYTYAEEGNAARAVLGDKSLSFAADASLYTLNTAQGASVLEGAKAVRMNDGSLFVPLRLVCEALGCRVTWDSYYEIAYAVDLDALVRSIDQNFTILNTLIAAEPLPTAPAKRLDGSIDLTAVLYGDEKDDKLSLHFDIGAFADASALDMEGSFTLDADDFSDSFLALLDEEERADFDQFERVPFEIIVDYAAGVAYGKSPLFSMIDPSIPDGLWHTNYSFPYLFSNPIADPNVLGASTIGKALLTQASTPFVSDIWEQATQAAQYMKLFAGDDLFHTTTNGARTVYSAKLDTLAFGLRAAQLGINGLEEFGELFDLSTPPALDYAVSFAVESGVLDDYAVSFALSVPGAVPMRLSFDVKGDARSYQASCAFAGRYIGKLTMESDFELSDTSASPRTEPPAGEKRWEQTAPALPPLD